MAETKERVAGGTLPDWDVEDLPAPPKYQFGKAFRNILGPGIIALGRFNWERRVAAGVRRLPHNTGVDYSGSRHLLSYFR